MPEMIETTVYRLDELNGSAKERARDWYRERALDNDWYAFVYEDFETISGILGMRLKTRDIPLMGGGTRQKPRILFSGFSSQGDGACFETYYSYEKAAPKKIRRHAPLDAELHRVADELQAIQRRNFYQLRAEASHRDRYCHEYSMGISVERESPTYQDVTADAEDAVSEALRDLARWLYRQLEREYDYQTSDAVIDEAISANEFTFTRDGRRFG
jgi:hypothetical protein